MPVYTEDQFRNYLKCPRLYSYQGEYLWPHLEMKVLKTFFERICSLYLKNSQYNKNQMYSDCLVVLNRYNKKECLLDSQYESLLNTIVFYSSQLFEKFNINNYYPITGPLYINKKISNSIVKVKVSGIFRQANQTINIVFFSPYSNRLDILNDPVLHFTSSEFHDLIKSHKSGRPKVSVHIFYYNSPTDIGYINYQPKKHQSNYTYAMEALERDVFNPRLPCSVNCKYKNKCEKENYVI